jgi:hypothetical protein
VVTVRHTPVPSQVRAGVMVEPVHVPGLHSVPFAQKRQVPFMPHIPSRPQSVAAVAGHWLATTGAVPAGTLEQVPSAVDSAQVLHAVLHAVSQQRPWAQNPELHSAVVVHVAPSGLSEHLLPLQMFGATQCASVVQLFRQMPIAASHWNAMHDCVVAAAQAPAALHSCGGVYVEPVHDPATHCVPGTCRRHAPEPLHVPSRPQVEGSALTHWLATTGAAPAPTGEQVPTVPVSAHDMQVPVQAALQQTPCAQKPDAQSDPRPDGQAPPIGILPQLMATQVFPDVHSLVAPHIVRHAVPDVAHV